MKSKEITILENLNTKNFYDPESKIFFSQVSGVNPRSGLNDYHILNSNNKITHHYTYWRDAYPSAVEIKQAVKCSEIDYSLSQNLYSKEILLKESSTKKIIKGTVVDTCFQGTGHKNKGIIVQFHKKDVKGLIKKYKMGKCPYSSRNKDHIECDLSNLFYGKHFTALITA